MGIKFCAVPLPNLSFSQLYVCVVVSPVTSSTSVSLSVGFKQSGLQVQGQGATPRLHLQSGWSRTRRSPSPSAKVVSKETQCSSLRLYLLSSSGCPVLLFTLC